MRVPEHLEATAKRMRAACIAETGAKEEIIEQARDGFIPDDPTLKCYILCLLEHYGMVRIRTQIQIQFNPTKNHMFQLSSDQNG